MINTDKHHMTSTEYREFINKPVKNKYHNIKTVIDGIKFDSIKEGERYKVLKMMEKAGLIKELKLQVLHDLKSEDKVMCRYKSDFEYFDVKTGKTIVEDVKGKKTAMYNLKKKMMKQLLGIEIKEI